MIILDNLWRTTSIRFVFAFVTRLNQALRQTATPSRSGTTTGNISSEP